MNFKNVIEKYKNSPVQVRAVLWYTICSILQKAMAFLVTPIFTRIMSTSDFGLYSLYNSWYYTVSIFATLNLYCGMFNNGMLDYKDRRDYYTAVIQGLSTVTAIIVFLVYLPFRKQVYEFTELTLTLCALMFLESLVTPALSYWLARQRYEYKYKAMVVITLGIAFFRPLISAVVVIMSNNKGMARIVSFVLFQFTVGVIFYIYNFIKGKKFFDKKIWCEALKLNIPLIPHYLSQTMLSQLDKIMIGFYYTKSEVAVYQLAYTLSMVTTIVNSSLNSAVVPWIYEKINLNKESDIGKIGTMLFIMVAGINIFITLFAKELIWILGGEKYMDAIYVIPSVTWSVFFAFVYLMFGTVEFYYKKTIYTMIGSLFACFTNFVLNYIFIPKFGYYAAGYTTLVSYMALAFAHYIFVKKIQKEKGINNIYSYKILFVVSLIGTLIVLFIPLTYKYDAVRYAIILGVLAICFICRKRIMGVISNIKEMKKKKKVK